MKVLVVPSWYPSKSYPNTGSFFKEQVEALKKNGIDVSVLCIDIPYRSTKKDFQYFKKNIYEENGVQVIRYVIPFSFLHRTPKLFYQFLKYFSKYIYKTIWKEDSFDVVHAHSFLIGGYVALQLKRNAGCKCIITEHSSKILLDTLNKTEKQILSECVEDADAFVCVSNNLRNHMKATCESKKDIYVYPNLVNNQFVFEPKTDKETFVFSSIGNLIPLKRMDLLIESFCKAFSAEENVRLDIAGAGSEYEKLESMIEKHGRTTQIKLHGLLPREDVGNLLQRSHVMALLSEKETFGVSYIEALAMGNVIVGVENGGANDIISKENGIFAHFSDSDEIAKSFRYVYENYTLYDPIVISKQCIDKYGEITFSKYYKNLFETV